MFHHRAPLSTTVVRHSQIKRQKPKVNVAEDGMQRLSVSLPPDLYAEIDKIAKRDSRSMAWVMRKAAEDLVKQEQPLFHQSP